jgi:photosystem II stability/assembly factor-like uncharacterized protein
MRRWIPTLLACAALFVAPAGAGALPFEHPRDFQAAAMVSGTEGWAQTRRGLYWTSDGGQSWRNITPPLAHPARLGSVRFETAERGWAMSEEGGEGRNRTALFATEDGGRSWTRTRIEVKGLLTQASGAYFAPVGAHEVFALVGEARNTAYSVGYLFVSHDDGHSWHQLPKPPPHAGAIAFSSPKDGWLAGGGPHPALYRTRDGGRSWSEVRLPRPPGLAEAAAGYLRPQFEAGGRGILAAAYANRGESATVVLYETADDGGHWKLAESTRVGVEGAAPWLLAYRGEGQIVAEGYPTPQLELLETAGSASRLGATGLPEEFLPALSFSGAEDGFAYVDGEECVHKIRCTETNQLYFTGDGGDSWAPVVRP